MKRGLFFGGGMLAAVVCLAISTGGFPSRPQFQAVGVGTVAPATAGVLNASSDVQIGGTSISGGAGASNIALKNAANTFTAQQTVQVASGASLNLDTSGAADTLMQLSQTGTAKAYFGVANGVNGICNGNAAGDACIRTQGGAFRLSTDSGSTSALVATKTTGSFTITGNGFTANPTATATYAVSGGIASVSIPSLSATSNATTFNLTGMPAVLQPATLSPIVSVYNMCSDNGTIFTTTTCGVKINAASGTWNVLDNGSNLWTASGIKAIGSNSGGSVTLTYPLN